MFGRSGIELWDLASLKRTKRLDLDKDPTLIYSLALSPDAHYVAFGCDRIELWDVETGERILFDGSRAESFTSEEPPPEGDPLTAWSILSLSCLADMAFIGSEEVAAVYYDGSFSIWNVRTRKCVRRVRIEERWQDTIVRLNWDGPVPLTVKR